MEERNWKAYVNGDILPAKDAKISVFDRAVEYGDGVFEGIRCYDGKIFKLDEHLRRLFDSARATHIDIPLSYEDMKQAIKDTTRANGFREAHIKPIVSRGVGWRLGLDPTNLDKPNVIIQVRPIAKSMYEGAAGGLRLAVVSVRKVPAYCIDPRIKSVNYIVNILARAEAQASGADDAIMLDSQGLVSESSGANIFLVRRDALYTAPVHFGLEGITRETVLTLGKENGIPTNESPLTIYDVYTADEVFVSGSGAGVVPVIEVDKKPINEGKPGRVTNQIIKLYEEAVKTGEPVF
ncbi:MAG: branched-chain-amino-acid transaminase [Methanomassiliicoccales archaeon]|nr:MAG: branched-chain-amino-acid transaminase [Methanomassiliicoccales archaeon]